MPFDRVNLGDIQTYLPPVEPRNSNGIFLLSGRNFAWDAKGPYSAYATRLLAGSTVIDEVPNITQGLSVGGFNFVTTFTAVRRWETNGSWTTIQALAPLVSPYLIPMNRLRWTEAYLQAGSYLCCPSYGIYRVAVDGNSLTLLDNILVPGLPADPVAIVETNGRCVILSEDYVYWSGPNAPEDLTPAPGGAGSQLLAERISGEPVALTAIPNGFIVWTTDGALIGEFIGGVNVFRFYTMTTEVLPVGAFAIQPMADGSHVMCSRLGIYRTVNGGQPTPLTPLFNEFLRERLRADENVNVALVYSIDENRLYVTLRNQTGTFFETYALELALDKWGIFSRNHIGIYTYAITRGAIGYTDVDGVAHRLLPASARGRDRELANSPGMFQGLDSEITVGYVRSQRMQPTADTLQELHEVAVSRPAELGVYSVIQDEGFLDTAPENVDEGLLTDPVTITIDESPGEIIAGTPVYGLEFIGDIFALNDAGTPIIIPELAYQGIEHDLWVGISSAYAHKLRLYAANANEYFHATSVAATIAYSGQQA